MSTKKIQIIGSFGTSVEIDSELSTEGKAADAKATGDAIAEVNDKFDSFRNIVEESLKFVPITQDDYNMLVSSGNVRPEIVYLIVGGTA